MEYIPEVAHEEFVQIDNKRVGTRVIGIVHLVREQLLKCRFFECLPQISLKGHTDQEYIDDI